MSASVIGCVVRELVRIIGLTVGEIVGLIVGWN